MTGFSAIGRLDIGTTLLRARIETLSRQLGDGRKGAFLGDIAPEANRAIDLRGEIKRRDAYSATISKALGGTATAQNALQGLSDIATRAFAVAQAASTANPAGVTAAAEEAKIMIVQVAQILNEQTSGRYIFGGKDSANSPLPNPGQIMSSGLVQQTVAAVQSLDAGNGAAVAAQTLAIAQSDAAGTTPFSDYMSDPARGLSEERRQIPAADGQLVAVGLFANRNTAVITQPNSTGAWARDLLRGLASLAGMSAGQTVNGASFDALVVDVRGALKAAINGIAQEQGGLGVAEQRLARIRTDHETITNTLVAQVSDIEDVDLASVITQMQATQTQLEASYKAIALTAQLTLTRFL